MPTTPTDASQFPVLLIDDDRTVGDIVTRIARKTFPEASFVAVQTPHAALSYLNELDKPADNAPKLILLDIDFGRGPDGLAFLPVLRQHPKASLAPTIMLSVLADENRVRQAYEVGAVSFLEKPMTYEGWQEQLTMLKTYWYEIVNLPSAPMGNDGGSSHYRTTL